MRVVHPLGRAEIARVDARFLDPTYPVWRRQAGLSPDEHPGIDLNVRGTSGDQDLGWPVVAVTLGRVVHARFHRVWGNIVLLEHPAWLAQRLGYPGLWTQYAHLHHIAVREGDWVWPGEPVGSIGKGDPTRPFAAHLHFEVRVRGPQDLPPDAWPRTRTAILAAGYLDPEVFLSRAMSPARRYEFPRGVVHVPEGRIVGPVVVNLEDPGKPQVRVQKDPGAR